MAHIEHSVCIVGSGFAGTFLGLHLADRGIDTVIVEAGGALQPHEALDGDVRLFPHFGRGDSVPPIDFNRSIAIGGTSRKWNGVTTRFQHSDFRSRSEFGLFADWPLTYDDLASYYTAAEHLLSFQRGSHRYGSEPDCPPTLTGGEFLELAPVGFSVRENIGGPIRLSDAEVPRFAAAGLLRSNRPATRVVAGKNGSAAGVEVVAPDGGSEIVHADHVVLAAGVLENVRLLFTSDARVFSPSLGNEHELLGRFVHAHPRPRLHVPRSPDMSHVRGLFRSLRYTDEFRRAGMAAICVDLNFLEEDPAVDVTLECEPAAENRIRLDPERSDAWGRPVAVLDCSATATDLRTREAAIDLQKRIASDVLAPGRPVRPAELKCFHPAGGCRMSRQPAEGVVDSDCRVFGTDNLYVAGASVFPTSGAGNPTLTIVALSLRLGDHIAAQI